MEWLIGVAVVIGFFVWQGFRTRCPLCGLSALHPRDEQRESEQRKRYESMQSTGMLGGLDRLGSSLGSERTKPGYNNRNLKCKSCGHAFGRREAVIWLTTSNKLGEEKALDEYKKLIANRDSEF